MPCWPAKAWMANRSSIPIRCGSSTPCRPTCVGLAPANRTSAASAVRRISRRTIAEVANYAYGKTDDGVWVNLYGGNVLDTTIGGETMKLTQEANYPWDGNIKITVNV